MARYRFWFLFLALKFGIASISVAWGLPLFTFDVATDDDKPTIFMVTGAAAADDEEPPICTAGGAGSLGGSIGRC